jgi:sulfide:quinone oxidoreductase
VNNHRSASVPGTDHRRRPASGIVAIVPSEHHSAAADDRLRVVVAGGGVGGLEGLAALRQIAGDRVDLTLLSASEEFVYRPLTVLEPFAFPRAFRYPVAPIASDFGAEYRRDALDWIDIHGHVVHTTGGAQVHYDALLLALGARTHAVEEHAITVEAERMDTLLHGLVQDIEEGYSKRIAFLGARPPGWPLPLYELALLTAHRAFEMGERDVELTLVTPEDSPLEIFGREATVAVSELLRDKGITVVTSSTAEVLQQGVVVLKPSDRRLEVDRVVVMPELSGPAVRGIPAAERGFIPVDVHGEVRGVNDIYAVGDAVDFPVKFGGIAAQQADVVAAELARRAGAQVEPESFMPVIRGILLTGEAPRYLMARVTGGRGFSSQISTEPLWDEPHKIAARYLAPYLDEIDARRGTVSHD